MRSEVCVLYGQYKTFLCCVHGGAITGWTVYDKLYMIFILGTQTTLSFWFFSFMLLKAPYFFIPDTVDTDSYLKLSKYFQV